ncbi:hypothetical protein K432DRAFT_467121, partial [Lepidopterella palustris CBS 459.81]
RDIVDNTCGIIFLGTPHYGSQVAFASAAAAFLTGFLRSNTTFLLALRYHEKQLSSVERRFRICMNRKEGRRQKTKIASFHEKMPTRLLGWFIIGLVSANAPHIASCLIFSMIVTEASAQGYAAEFIDIDTGHSGLNKCSRRKDQLCQELKRVLNRLGLYVVLI